MVKDPGAGAPINIDTRAAVGAVTLDVRGAMAADLGQAKMGEAIANTGGYLTQLALKQMEAINVTKVAEAQDMMTEAESTMKVAMIKEPDETKWEGIAAEHTTLAQGRISKMALSPAAKQQVDADFSRWQTHRAGQVKVESARQSFDKATAKVKNRTLLAQENQDPIALGDNLEGGRLLGIYSDEDVEIEKKKYAERGKQLLVEKEAEAFNQGVNSAVAVASGSGEEVALADLERGVLGKFNATQKEKVRSAIQSVARDRAQTIIGEVTNNIVNGTIKDESQINAIDSPHMTPALKKHAADLLRDFNADEAKKDREVNGVRNAVEMRRKVKDYDPNSDPDRTKYFALVHEIGARADQTSAGELTGELYQKYGGKPPKMQVRPEIQQNVSKSLDALYDPETGVIPWRTKTKDSTGTEVISEDLEKRREAINAQTKVEMKMNDWFRDHPEDAQNLTKVQEQLDRVLPEGTRKMALDSLKAFQKARENGSPGDKGPAGVSDFRGFSAAPDLQSKLPAGLQPYAQDYLDAAREYNLNPRVLAAISALETGGGTSKAFREKLNAMGISDANGPTTQASVRDSIFRQARTLARGDGPYARAKTLDEIGAIYAPPGASNDFKGSNDGWAENVRAWLARL